MKQNDKNHRIYKMSFASVYPHYVNKAEKKGHKKEEVDKAICWLTGYTQKELDLSIKEQIDFETFFTSAPNLNSERKNLIQGTICGVKIAEINEPLMKEIRYLDKLIDDLANGRKWVGLTI